MHIEFGFEHSYFEGNYVQRGSIEQNPWLPDREFFEQTIEKLSEQPHPFMAFLITATSHHPYKLQRQLRVLNLNHLEDTLVGGYLHTIHYLDQSFGLFLKRLRETGLRWRVRRAGSFGVAGISPR